MLKERIEPRLERPSLMRRPLIPRRAARAAREGAGVLAAFAGLAVVAHVLLAAALIKGPALYAWLTGHPPPRQPDMPEQPAQIEMVVEKTPNVGGSRQSTPAPSATAKPQAAPESPAPLTSRDAPDSVAPPARSQANATTPAPPAPRSAAASGPAAQQEAAAAPQVNLDPDQAPGYGEASGDEVIPAGPDSKVHNNPPFYPHEAAERGEQGTVGLIVSVAPDGSASHVEIASSSGYKILDDEALRTVSGWHFRPAVQGGHPVPSYFNQQIEFSIAGQPHG